MVINHIEKLFVTSDAATILRELEVAHPAARLLVMAAKQQEEESGDGTNLTLIFAGALLERAENLLRMGLSVCEVVAGYELALQRAIDLLTGDEKTPGLCCGRVSDLTDRKQVRPVLRTAVASKVPGYEDFLADLVVDACVPLLSKDGSSFNVDSVRVSKMPGAGLLASHVVRGMVFPRQAESTVQSVAQAKVAVFTCPLDSLQTETKGTVLINTAQQLMDYSKGEENLMEQQLKAIAETGATVVVSGGKVGDLALHYANQYGLMVVRLQSKFDIRRLCRTVGATPLPHVTPPSEKELGRCDAVSTDEIGDTPVVIFRQADTGPSAVSTIVIRGATASTMDDMERAIDDAVNTYKALTRDARLVPGAASTEIELAARLAEYAETRTGLDQYAVSAFGLALESVPRALCDNAGLRTQQLLARLYAAHRTPAGRAQGVDLATDDGAVSDATQRDVVDVMQTKIWALKFATAAANTVLQVDQIIMAKPAGGPKPKENKHWDDD